MSFSRGDVLKALPSNFGEHLSYHLPSDIAMIELEGRKLMRGYA